MLWLWLRPAATAPIRPLAWEPPYATGVAQEIAKKTKKKKKKPVLSPQPDPWPGNFHMLGAGTNKNKNKNGQRIRTDIGWPTDT